MPAGVVVRVLGPPIARAAVAAGRAAWAWMMSSEGAAVGAATAAVLAEEVARKKAEQLLRDTFGDEVCISCAVACQALACGVPGSPYRGGADWCMKQPGKHSHHMPAKDAYNKLPPGAGFLPDALGPAIQMDPGDHLLTASNPFGPYYKTAYAYRAAQSVAIASGNFVAAQFSDVGDVESKFPGKYTAAIAQMTAYTACMKAARVIN
jgi:hypothetical protein